MFTFRYRQESLVEAASFSSIVQLFPIALYLKLYYFLISYPRIHTLNNIKGLLSYFILLILSISGTILLPFPLSTLTQCSLLLTDTLVLSTVCSFVNVRALVVSPIVARLTESVFEGFDIPVRMATVIFDWVECFTSVSSTFSSFLNNRQM